MSKSDQRKAIESWANATAKDKLDPKKQVFKVSLVFYLSKQRWRLNDGSIPREDNGMDVDNLAKPILDGLGPIIGYRNKYTKDTDTGKWKLIGTGPSSDSKIVELHVKKLNSGSKDKEEVKIEIELIDKQDILGKV
jgi:Holliday junction resolvase RusA-like endonuclease